MTGRGFMVTWRLFSTVWKEMDVKKSRFWLGGILSLALAVVLSSGCGSHRATSESVVLPRENRPNIIFIFTDDLDSKLNTIDYMQSLQKLMVDRGVNVENFLITDPVCCPSRTTVLRGQYSHSHQVFNNTPPNGGFIKFKETGLADSTIGSWMQSAGYRTALMGKFLNAYPYSNDRKYVPPGWSEWVSHAKNIPYNGYDYVLNENGVLVEYPPKQVNYFTDVLNRKANDFIERAAKDKIPFFLYLAPVAPHVPSTPAARHLDMFPDVRVPITPSFNEEDVSDKPGATRFNPPLTDANVLTLSQKYRERILAMQAVDEMIAALINTLDENSLLENTYIIFSSDNGFHLGQHRLFQGKSTLYEEDIVVPFIVRGPGIPEGKTISGALSGNVDITATIAEWAGIVPPSFVEGRSLARVLTGEPVPADWRQAFLLEVYPELKGDGENGGRQPLAATASLIESTLGISLLDIPKPFDPLYHGLRTNAYKYVEYNDGALELYDLMKDPYELENLASSADSQLLEIFSAWLKDMSTCNGALCREIESKKLMP